MIDLNLFYKGMLLLFFLILSITMDRIYNGESILYQFF